MSKEVAANDEHRNNFKRASASSLLNYVLGPPRKPSPCASLRVGVASQRSTIIEERSDRVPRPLTFFWSIQKVPCPIQALGNT